MGCKCSNNKGSTEKAFPFLDDRVSKLAMFNIIMYLGVGRFGIGVKKSKIFEGLLSKHLTLFISIKLVLSMG